MTVSSSTNKIIGTGNGVTTSWPFSFKVLDPDHLIVTYTDVAGDETTLDPGAYAAALNADQDASPGGSVTYSPAIASGTRLTILRSVPYTQAIDLKNQGGFFPEVLERGFDLMVMQVQQLREQLARALKLSPSQSAISELEATDAARAGSYLGFDLAGNLSIYAGLAAQSVSTAMQPVASAASLALARAAMGLGGLATLNKAANGDLADMAQGTLKGRLTAGSGAAEDLDAGQVNLILNALIQPGGRLSLASALPVPSTDVTAAQTLYYTHHTHDLVPLWDGSHWRNRSFSELSLSLDGNSGHAGYHQAGKNFDVFLFDDGGTLRIGTPAAWPSDTARTAYLSRQNGRWVNSTALDLRHGSGALDVVNKGAGLALYFGTFRTTADGQTEDSAAKRFVWNTYNRVQRFMRVLEETNAWNYTAAAWRQANGNATNQLEFVRGVDEDRVNCWVYASAYHDSAPVSVSAGIGLDSSSVPAMSSARVTVSVSNVSQISLNPDISICRVLGTTTSLGLSIRAPRQLPPGWVMAVEPSSKPEYSGDLGMTMSLTRSERWARNAILTLVARCAALCAVPLMGWNVKTLIDLQAAIQRIPDQILVVETRLAGRIDTVEIGVSAQSRRSDGPDQRVERLERPYFEPNRRNQ